MKKLLSILFIGIISLIIFPSSANAKSISTLEVKNSGQKITVSGTTESGVLAIAVLVYSGEELVTMETCSSNNDAYSCELENAFKSGTYTVKVADYDGGAYITKSIKIVNATNPKTSDNSLMYLYLACISSIGLLGYGIYFKNKMN